MSYSEFITIYTEKNKIDFNKVATVCKTLYNPRLVNDYLGGENIFEYIARSLIKDRVSNSKEEYIFHFINHDGENDEKVHKAHKIFCKVCNYMYDCMIELKSQISQPNIYFIWDRDNGLYRKPKDKSEKASEFKDYFEKVTLLEKANKIKDINIKEVMK